MVILKCAVKGCQSTSQKKSTVLFNVPIDEKLFKQWQEKVETHDGSPLTNTSKVCELHFPSRLMRKEIIAYKNYKNSLRTVLSKTAVPSLNLPPLEKKVISPSSEETAVTSEASEESNLRAVEEENEPMFENSNAKSAETLQAEAQEVDTHEVELQEMDAQEIEIEGVEKGQTEETIEEELQEVNALEIEIEGVQEGGADEMERVESQDIETEQVEIPEIEAKEVDVQEVETKDGEVGNIESEEAEKVELEVAENQVVTTEVEAQEIETKEVEAQEAETQGVEILDAETEENRMEESGVQDKETNPDDGQVSAQKDEVRNNEAAKTETIKIQSSADSDKASSEQTVLSKVPIEAMETAEVVAAVNSNESTQIDHVLTVNSNMSTEGEEAEISKNVDSYPTISIAEPQPSAESIKAATVEAGRLDVLVCGNCHTVFHFIEEFQSHKDAAACNETSLLKSSITEPKPQVWAFLIWKNSQIADGSSWKLYQRWCQMSKEERSVWVTAGSRLQECAALSRLKTPCKGEDLSKTTEKIVVTKSVRKSPMKCQLQTVRTFVTLTDKKGSEDKEAKEAVNNVKNNVDSECSESQGEVYSSGMEDGEPTQKAEIGAGDSALNAAGGILRIKEEVTSDDNEEPAKQKMKPKRLSKQLKPRSGDDIDEDDDNDSNDSTEYSVERIVSRRYNTKKKQFEYLLKWEGYPDDQNTWEPAENLATCQHLLKAYEANLAKRQQAHEKVNSKTILISALDKKSEVEQRRPQRNSKQKALDQVKQWCGTMKNDEFTVSGKRKLSESTDDEGSVNIKKIKNEKEVEISISSKLSSKVSEESSETLKTPMNGLPGKKRTLSTLTAELGIGNDDEQTSKTSSSPIKPVIRSISSLSQQNQEVLVANAKGVVKVDPSQVPNLSSGVYIMSNKSGIVKLDSLSPKKALSSLRKTGMLPQTTKSGVVVLKNQVQQGLIKSGILPKSQAPHKILLQETVPTTPKVPVHKTILPKPIVSSPRPTGLLRPSSTSTPRPLRPITPRMPVFSSNSKPPPLSKIQFPPIRPRGTTQMGRPPLAPKIKPIQSILGSALLASEDKTIANRTKTTPSILVQSNQSAVPKVSSIVKTPVVASTKKVTNVIPKISKNIAAQGARLVENDKILMEFQQESDSDSDYGLEDDFPSDLPPLESIPDSPPRPLTLDPITGERLMKAEGERTPSPEPSPERPSEPTIDPLSTPMESNSPERVEEKSISSTELLSKSDGTLIKVEMSPGGTTGTVTETSSVNPEDGLEFTALTEDCDVSGLRVKKILSPSSELEQQEETAGKEEQPTEEDTPMEGVEIENGQEVEDSIIHVTGEDGTVYQVSSSQLNGETLLLSEGGEDGTQQCVFVTEEGGDGTVLALDPAYANSVAQLVPEQIELLANSEASAEESDQAQVVAQLVEAGEPSPSGGLRRVVLLLPDGNLMMTEVDEEQYAALELDK